MAENGPDLWRKPRLSRTWDVDGDERGVSAKNSGLCVYVNEICALKEFW